MSDLHKIYCRGRRWWNAQAEVWSRPGSLCGRCGEFVDQARYNDPNSPEYNPNHPMARSVGHIVDLQFGGAPYDPANLQLEHRRCNSKAGRASQVEPWSSRDW